MALPATYDFAGSGALSASWTTLVGTPVRSSDVGKDDANSFGGAKWTADGFGADQTAQVKVGNLSSGTNLAYVVLRAVDIDNCIVCGCDGTDLRIFCIDSGTFCDLATIAHAVANGDLIKAEIIGQIVYMYHYSGSAWSLVAIQGVGQGRLTSGGSAGWVTEGSATVDDFWANNASSYGIMDVLPEGEWFRLGMNLLVATEAEQLAENNLNPVRERYFNPVFDSVNEKCLIYERYEDDSGDYQTDPYYSNCFWEADLETLTWVQLARSPWHSSGAGHDIVNYPGHALNDSFPLDRHPYGYCAIDEDNGYLYLSGGAMGNTGYADEAMMWRLNLSTLEWTKYSNENPYPNYEGTAVWDMDRYIINNGLQSNGYWEQWDAATHTWSSFSPPTGWSNQKDYANMCVCNGKLVVFGGKQYGGDPVQTTFVCDLSDDSWTYPDPVTKPAARAGHGMCADEANNRVIIYGGFGTGGTALNDTWAFNLDDSTWEDLSATGPTTKNYQIGIVKDTVNNLLLIPTTSAISGSGWYDEVWVMVLPAVAADALSFHDKQRIPTHLLQQYLR